MTTVLLDLVATAGHNDVLLIATGPPNSGGLRVVLFIVVAIATAFCLHLITRAIAPAAEVIKLVLVVALAAIVMAVVVGLAVVLAITSI
jgi:hypothetical protein